jgi:hypothetical protein
MAPIKSYVAILNSGRQAHRPIRSLFAPAWVAACGVQLRHGPLLVEVEHPMHRRDGIPRDVVPIDVEPPDDHPDVRRGFGLAVTGGAPAPPETANTMFSNADGNIRGLAS